MELFMKNTQLLLILSLIFAGNCLQLNAALLPLASQIVAKFDHKDSRFWLPKDQWTPILNRIIATDAKHFSKQIKAFFTTAESLCLFQQAGIDITDPVIKKQVEDSCQSIMTMAILAIATSKYVVADNGVPYMPKTVLEAFTTDKPEAKVRLKITTDLIISDLSKINPGERALFIVQAMIDPQAREFFDTQMEPVLEHLYLGK